MPEKYEEQHITVDIAILTSEDETIQKLKVLLIKRRDEPFKDHHAIPGGYVNKGETLEQAALRELQEETSLSPEQLKGYLHQFKAYGDPERDPRGRIVSVVFYAILPYSKELLASIEAKDDAKEADWFYLQIPPEEMAFDHCQILRDIFVTVVCHGYRE
jgi:8-oxo-dGTP diphosphatase